MNVRCPQCGTVYRIDPAKVPQGGTLARCARCPGIIDVRVAPDAPAPEAPGARAPEAPPGPADVTAGVAAAGQPGSQTGAVESSSAATLGGTSGAGASSPAAAIGDSSGTGISPAAAAPGEATGTEISSSARGPGDASGTGATAPAAASTAPVTAAPEPIAPGDASDDKPPAASATAPGPGAEPEPAPFGSADPYERARRLARALVSDIVAYHGDRRDRALREGRLRQELAAEIKKSWETYSAQVGNEIARRTSYFRDALNEILARGQRLF